MNQPPFEVIARTSAWWLLHKRAGLSFHRTPHANDLFTALRAHFPDTRFYPVHRLDQDTSGLLLVATSSEAAATLGSQWQQRQVEKYYLALSHRPAKKKRGWVIGDMQSSRNGNWKLTPQRQQPAVSEFFSFGLGNGLRGFLLKPHTGRTHQLRVALKSQSAPILGDTRYGGQHSDRLYLHAYRLCWEWQDQRLDYCVMPDHGEHFLSEAWKQKLTTLGDVRQYFQATGDANTGDHQTNRPNVGDTPPSL